MPRSYLGTLFLVLAGMGATRAPAVAGWSADPVTVRPTTAGIPLVAACNDGGFGTFVSWQEEPTAGSGFLRIQHLLPTGDLDPAWPAAGALASDAGVGRVQLGMVADGLGGAYVWWTEAGFARALYVNRMLSPGVVAPGWPARGRPAGSISASSPAPRVVSDGANGIYLVRTTDYVEDPTAVCVVRFDPSGAVAASRCLGMDEVPTIDLWPQIAPAPDGGAYVAWGSWSQDESARASSYLLARLTGTGATAAGWPDAGRSLGAFHPDWLGGQKDASLLALAADGRGGVWALAGDATLPGGYPPSLSTLLYRLQSDGQSAADWPAAGMAAPGAPGSYWLTQEPASYRALPDGSDGVILGVPEICVDCSAPMWFVRVGPTGAAGGLGGAQARGLEVLVREDGGLDLAAFQPTGPTGPYQPSAFIAFSQSGGPSFSEYHSEPSLQWFGDVGLASCGASQALFFWSQTRDRFGLFARRFGLSGQVTAVGTQAPADRGLRLNFVPGRGVVARVHLAGGAGDLRLYDLAGRLVATSRLVQGSGRVEVTMPSTTGISSGLYFARFTSAARRESGKLVVAR